MTTSSESWLKSTWAETLLPWANHHNMHMIHSTFIVLLLALLSLMVYRKLSRTEARIVPEARGSATNVFEVLVEKLLGLMEGIIGPDAHKYFPLIGTLFIYIFVCNAIALIPGFLPPTENINTGLACGLASFLYYNYLGFKEGGLNYLKHFMGPIWWLAILIFPIEMIGNFIRPLSLSLRLFWNINGDHLVLGIFSGLAPLLIPILFLMMGLFVAFLQAFVFSLLSMIYIGLATQHDHGHEEAHH